jgi:DNA polymerase V
MDTEKNHGGRRAGAGRRPGPQTRVVRLPVPIAEFARKLAAARKPGDVAAFLDVESRTAQRVPMMAWSAACGFPSPAEDLCRPAARFQRATDRASGGDRSPSASRVTA